MDSLPLWAGTVAAAAAAAGALLPLDPRRRTWLIAAALLLAPLLLAADNWDGARISELRDRPALAVFAVALALATVAVLAALFARRPRLLVLAAFAVLPFRIPVDLAGSTAHLLLPLYAVVAGGVAAALARPGRLTPRPPPRSGPAALAGIALAAFLLLYALQSGYSDDISAAVENVGFFFIPFTALFLLLVQARWDRALLRGALAVAVVAALVVAAVGFGQYATGELFWNQKVIAGNEAHAWFRVNSLFFDPNIMGRYLAITMVAVLALVAWGRERRSQVAAAVIFAALLGALMLTFSQSGMLALIAAVPVIALGRWGLLAGALATVASVAALGLAVLVVSDGGLTAETTGRTGLISGGLELAEERPLAGHGAGSFADEFRERFGGGDGIAVVSHTEPVTVAAEQGVIGLLPYAALLALALGTPALRAGLGRDGAADPVAAATLAALFAMVVHSLGYAAFFTDPITWALLALAIALPGAITPARHPSAAEAG